MEKYYNLYSRLSDGSEITLEDESLLRQAKAEIHDDILSRMIDVSFSVGTTNKRILKNEIVNYCGAKAKEELATE